MPPPAYVGAMRTLRPKLAIALTALLTAMGPARAATFVVDTTDDGHDAVPGDGICATDDGHCTFRAALEEAESTAMADVIQVPAGSLSWTLGEADVSTDIVVEGAGADTTVLPPVASGRLVTVG